MPAARPAKILRSSGLSVRRWRASLAKLATTNLKADNCQVALLLFVTFALGLTRVAEA